jgi:hypothetical protein
MQAAASHIKKNTNDEANTFYSVTVDLQGRMMRQDYTEQKCTIKHMSPASALVAAANMPVVGERIVSYIEQIGRIEGHVVRLSNQGFELSINATARKQSKVAAQLTWLANKHELGLEEDRRHDRATPRNMNSEIRLEDGRTYPCRIIDLSVSGAAFEIDVIPEMNTVVWLGSMKGRVIRQFDTGISIEFITVQPISEIEKRI